MSDHWLDKAAQADPANSDVGVIIGICMLIAAPIAGVAWLFGAFDTPKKPEKPSTVIVQRVYSEDKETTSHKLGRKTRESGLEFLKGAVGLDGKKKEKVDKERK